MFFIDIEGHAEDPHVAKALEELKKRASLFRILGSYPARGDVNAEYRAGPGGAAAGELTVPGDKSVSHRALMLGGIARGVTDITGFLAGEDCLATLRALQALGVRIERPEDQHVIVHGVGPEGLRGSSAAWIWGMQVRRCACQWDCSRPRASTQR